MSAFMVSTTHIDAMLTAGIRLAYGPFGPLSWLAPAPAEHDPEMAYQRGEPWGPEAVRQARERKRELRQETAGHVGAMLLAENRRSVNHRYDEDEWEEPYEFTMLGGTPDPVVVLDAVSCYEYQACEHPEWESSEAHAFCEALRNLCIDRLPRPEGRTGEITDPRVFLRP